MTAAPSLAETTAPPSLAAPDRLRPQPHGRLLLVTAVRLRRGPNGLQLDSQTCAGICRWAEHFNHVAFAGILLETEQEDGTTADWVDVASLPCAAQLTFHALPMAYRVGAFARTYRATRKLLADAIRQADSLCFTLGYVIGDWAAIAALEAHAQGRRYAVWFDRVEHEVIRNLLPSLPLKRRVKEQAMLLAMGPYHRLLTRRSSLALLQGMDTFNAYSAFSTNPACVYDVHTLAEDFASAPAIAEKIARIESGAPLRLVYIGRAAEMKGPIDWLEAIAGARSRGVELEAEWLGDGPLLDAMRQRATALGIADCISFAGHVGDREVVLSRMRQADIFLFCHKTPESPRCLIEALVCACPIVGYAGAYPAGLLARGGGGLLSPLNDPAALADALARLHGDREGLARLVREAAATGRCFDEEKLYGERAGLIAAHG
ncbi:MAG: glycosyltransferase [Bosea sp.]|nr:glycosyltransferase [Bosea sp. (in: a-proteobacteria)]